MTSEISMDKVKEISAEKVLHFFDLENMKHSNSIIESKQLYMRKFFITSEKSPDFGGIESPRKYAVHEFDVKSGKVLGLSGTQAFDTKKQSEDYMHSLKELTDNQKEVISALNHNDYSFDANKARIAWRTGNKYDLHSETLDKLGPVIKDRYCLANEEVSSKRHNVEKDSKVKRKGMEL